MAAEPILGIRPVTPPREEIPAFITGDGWEEVRKRAPGDTGRRLAKQILEHLAERRGGVLKLSFCFDKQGNLWHVEFKPAKFKCLRGETTG